MSGFRDFDICEDERTGKPPGFTYKGEHFELPPELPAECALAIVRMQAEMGGNADVPTTELSNLAQGLLGEENLKRLYKLRISMVALGKLITKAIEAYTPGEIPADTEPGAAQGNAEPPKPAAREESSKTGD